MTNEHDKITSEEIDPRSILQEGWIMSEEQKAPERIRVAQDADGFWTCREAVSGSQEYIRADLAQPSQPDEVARLKAEQSFNEWFCKNYPGPDTIIHNPKWHAPRILRAARAALAASPTHRSHDMTDAKLLTEALGNIGAMGYSDDPAVASGIAKAAVDMARKARADYFAALAAAPQPATPGQRMIRAAEEAHSIFSQENSHG